MRDVRAGAPATRFSLSRRPGQAKRAGCERTPAAPLEGGAA